MNEINFGLVGLYAVAVWSLLVTPGPVTLLVVRAGLSGGMRHAFQTICGTNLASLILIFVSSLLINGVLVIGNSVFSILRLLGCFYIVWMAYGMLREAIGITSDSGSSEIPAPESAGFKRGFMLAISNPKDIVFFSSFFPQFINVLPSQNGSLLLLVLMWIILDFTTLLTLSYVIRSITGPSLQKKLIMTSSILLLLIGGGGAVYAVYELMTM